MTWTIQSVSEGPVIIQDLNIILHKNQMKDLDLAVGRQTAERSNDLKVLFNLKHIETRKKDEVIDTTIDPKILTTLTESANKANEAANNAMAANQANMETIHKLEEQVKIANEQNAEMGKKMDRVLDAVAKFAESHPIDIRVMKEAMENIAAERQQIAIKKELVQNEENSDSEVALQTKILNIKDKKLEKNYNDIGKSIVKNIEDANVEDSLNAMDELGI